MEQLSKLHRLLRKGSTGTPARLSRRLGMSRSKLYVVISDLRARGAAIGYSRRDETFYYKNDFVIDIRCTLYPLSQERTGRAAGSAQAN